MQNQYKPAMLLDVYAPAAMGKIRVGQWITTSAGQRGQYLGVTSAGTIVIRWQNGKFEHEGDGRDTLSNHHLRKFAKLHGAK